LLPGKAKFLLVSTLLVALSLAYQYWLYPKLLEPVSPHQVLQNIEWQADSSIDCSFEKVNQQCILTSKNHDNNRFIGRLFSADSDSSVVFYDLVTKFKPSLGNTKKADYKVVFISDKSGFRQWDKPHHFFKLDSSQASSNHGRLYFNEPVNHFQLLVELEGTGSSLIISEFSFFHAQETVLNSVVQTVLFLLWMLMFWIAIRWLFQLKNGWNYPLVVMLLVTLLGTQLPNESFTPLKNWIKERHTEMKVFTDNNVYALNNINLPETATHTTALAEKNPIIVVKTIAHLVLFALLALFLWLRFKSSLEQLLWVLSFLLLFAAATETLQALGKVRSSSILDVGIDMAGVAMVLLVMAVIAKMKRSY